MAKGIFEDWAGYAALEARKPFYLRFESAEAEQLDHEEAQFELQAIEAEHEIELQAERAREDLGWMEARLQEEMEARAGVIPFDVALAEARQLEGGSR